MHKSSNRVLKNAYLVVSGDTALIVWALSAFCCMLNFFFFSNCFLVLCITNKVIQKNICLKYYLYEILLKLLHDVHVAMSRINFEILIAANLYTAFIP